jgi:hypothetical protein
MALDAPVTQITSCKVARSRSIWQLPPTPEKTNTDTLDGRKTDNSVLVE